MLQQKKKRKYTDCEIRVLIEEAKVEKMHYPISKQTKAKAFIHFSSLGYQPLLKVDLYLQGYV